jgi:HEAT repeat protein
VAEVQPALLEAARDHEPRVREAALQALAGSPVPARVDVARAVLASDGWSFVKAQAVGVLSKAPPSSEVDESLRAALRDASGRVRTAVVVAAALRRAGALRGAVRERLDDEDEDVDVRQAAAAALGSLCDMSSVDRLTEHARQLGSPGTPEGEQPIALGALFGLAALQPKDLRDRLAPLLSPSASPEVRAAAQKALAAHGVCR